MNSITKDYNAYILLILKDTEKSIKEIKYYHKNFNIKNIINTLNELIENKLVIKRDKYQLTKEGENIVKELEKVSYMYNV